MTGIELFNSYFKEGDVFLWSRIISNVPIMCEITDMHAVEDHMRCNTARKDSRCRTGWDHSTGTLCKLKENAPYVYKVLEDYLEGEWKE